MHSKNLIFILAALMAGFLPGLPLLAEEGGSVLLRYDALASWYGKEFAGRPTSSGEIYNPEDLTAAHKDFPFGTRVKVTNLDNGKQVEVRITDRGPFIPGREIDLSQAAARQLDMLVAGVARVRLEVQVPADSPLLKTRTAGAFEAGTKANDHKTIQVASFSNRDSALGLIKFLHDSGLDATEEASPNGYYRVVIADVGPERLDWNLKALERLGYTQVLLRSK